jgi:hypothetical protein
VLGYLVVDDLDMFHIIGRFWPGPDFPRHEPLLTTARRKRAEDADDWLETLEGVNVLNLSLEDPVTGRRTPIRDFQLDGLSQLREPQGESCEFKFVRG